MSYFNKGNLLFEIILALVTLSMFGMMVIFLFAVLIMPINNYHHAQGFVEYKKQFKVVSQIEGVVEAVYKDNNAVVKKGEPILKYSSEKNELEIAALVCKESLLVKELNTLSKLCRLGAVYSAELDKKKLEIDELNVRKEYLKRKVICSPISGNIYFKILPEYIKGTYIEQGQELAYIYTEEDKHVKISFPNEFADRFKIGSSVVIKYKDPCTFKIQKMHGIIYKSFINNRSNTIELYCEITKGKDYLRLFFPSTMVSALVVINNSSIYEDLFGIPISPSIQNIIINNPLYEKIKSSI